MPINRGPVQTTMYIHTLEYYTANKKDREALDVTIGTISEMYWNTKVRHKCLLPFKRKKQIYLSINNTPLHKKLYLCIKNISMPSSFLIASGKGHWYLEDLRQKEIYFSLPTLSETFNFSCIKNIF